MRSTINSFLFAGFLLACPLQGDPFNFQVKAESAILMNGKTGAILYQKNAHNIHNPASITKIATTIFSLLAASDKLDETATADHDTIAMVSVKEKSQSKYTLPSHWLEPGYSNIGMKKGETYVLRDLLYGLMLVSGDDAANLIAKKVGGTVPLFMDGVNAYLKSIGCINTCFTNPHGLYHPQHYTTAFDMALLTKEALKHPLFREIVKKNRYTRPKTNLQETTTWVQSNLLLRPGKHYYPYAIGVKTGYIMAAQNTFVGAAEKDGRLLIVVLLKTKVRKDMFDDAITLFDTVFKEQLVERKLFNKGPQTFKLENSAAASPVETYLDEDIAVQYYPSEEPELKCKLVWDSVNFPVLKGQKVGELLISSLDGQHDQKIELKANNDVQKVWWKSMMNFFNEWTTAQIIAATAFVLVLALGLVKARHRH